MLFSKKFPLVLIVGVGAAISIQQAIFSGDSAKLQSLLEIYMLQSIASIDGANESFYHGMMFSMVNVDQCRGMFYACDALDVSKISFNPATWTWVSNY